MANDTGIGEIAAWLDRRLNLADFPRDHSNNGLQVEAQPLVRRVAAGVDGCAALFERAAAAGADLVLVHHGLSWGGEPRRLDGWTGRRFGLLFANGINLYACHLPLDAHPEIGNNARLAHIAGLAEKHSFYPYDGGDIGFYGLLPEAVEPEVLAALFETALPATPRIFSAGALRRVRRVGIVSGGAGTGGVEAAAAAGCELLVTGEMEHVMYHAGRELGVDILALGHYASETVGIKALLEEVGSRFGLPGEFIDIPTGL